MIRRSELFEILRAVSCALLALSVSLSFSGWANAQSSVVNLLMSKQTWHINCLERGCLASVDILRGESGDPPNPKNSDDYISITVGVDRNNRQPSLLMFEVDSQADEAAGIDLMFARTVPDGKTWKMVLDPNGPVHLPFKHCKNACSAVIGGGTPDEKTLKSCADLVVKYNPRTICLCFIREMATLIARPLVSLSSRRLMLHFSVRSPLQPKIL